MFVNNQLAQLEDGELVRRTRAGDEHALQVLLDRHADRLRERIRRWLSPSTLRKISASDIQQDAYVVAYQRLEEFQDRGTGAFGAWLGRIVENKAKHAVRRFTGTAKRGGAGEVSRDGRAATANFVGRVPSPSQVAISAELEERARRAIAALALDYREIIRLRQTEHLSVQEAAARMGRTQAAVKKLYARALAQLARMLGLEEERNDE